MDFTINASIECMFLPLDLISQSLWTHMAHANVFKMLKLDLFLSSEHIIFVKVKRIHGNFFMTRLNEIGVIDPKTAVCFHSSIFADTANGGREI